VHKHPAPGRQILYGGAKYVWIVNTKLGSSHPNDTEDFEVVSRFLESLCSHELPNNYFVVTLNENVVSSFMALCGFFFFLQCLKEITTKSFRMDGFPGEIRIEQLLSTNQKIFCLKYFTWLINILTTNFFF
jgi:hypothetical protein